MFSRSQNRSVHGTSYTGVSPAASRASQPNSNALAAALSIGKSLKQQGNPESYEANGWSNPQFAKPPQKRNSLLKRNSITRSPGNNKIGNVSDFSYNSAEFMHTPPDSGQRRRSSIQGPAKGIYDVDDSFDDSYFDEMVDTTQNYNNAKMKDLRLSHQMSPPSSRNEGSHQGNVKMVKKYIPTPNGIKIIEVPETIYKKEVARNNSMRSMPRSGSMTSLSQRKMPRTSSLSSFAGANKKISHQRLSSIGKSPALKTMAENDEAEYKKKNSNNSDLEKLQQQIDYEKKASRDLELKRLEYEKAKLQRLENEKKVLLLQREAMSRRDNSGGINETIDDEEEDVPIPNLLVIVDEVENKHIGKNKLADAGESTIQKPSLGAINDTTRDEDTIDETSLYADEAIPDASINASSVVVDELEKKNLQGNGEELENGSKNDKGAAELNVISQYTESKENLNRDNIMDNPIFLSADEEDDFGIEEVPIDKSNEGNLAKHLRPTFNPQTGAVDNTVPTFNPNPEIISPEETVQIEKLNINSTELADPKLELNIQTLKIPLSSVNNDSTSSSVRSNGSFDSNNLAKDEKRPVKSAMKNSNSLYSSSNNSSVVKNAAQDAYLSLATAENTRLNSKLSSSQLNDTSPQFNGGAIQMESSSHANSLYLDGQFTQPKRSTLRKSPSSQSGGLASRSLRPQSTTPELFSHSTQHQNSDGGMGSRKLRDRSSMQVSPGRDRASYLNPISAHPALQPNYQSPSKVRAAELYAKANARPYSSFSPNSKKDVNDSSVNKQQMNKSHRTTLRDISSPNHIQQAEKPLSNVSQNKKETASTPMDHRRGYKSRLADSDEENDNAGRSKFFGGGFSSRFNDSDEEVGGLSRSHQTFGNNSSSDTSRKNEGKVLSSLTNGRKYSLDGKKDQSLKSKPKEKKKFAKLRKLFGKD